MIKNVLSVVGVAILIVCLLTYPTMYLWNWLMPEIFGLKTLTFIETLGLLFLARLLISTSNTNNNNK